MSGPATLLAQPAEEDVPPAPAPAPIDASTQACVDAFEHAQVSRHAGQLLASRRELLICARAECPQVIIERCVPWLTEVRAALPSVVVAARDAKGRDTAEVSVIVDDRKLAERLDGRAIEVDPGMRRFRFEHAGARSIEKQLLIVQGVKARSIDLQFTALPAGAFGASSSSLSPLAIVGWSVAGAGVLVGAITGGIAIKRGQDLQARCPNKQCTTTDPGLPDDYAEAQVISHVSTTSFAVAGVGVVLGVIGLLIGTGDDDPDPPRVSLRLGPASLGLAGAF